MISASALDIVGGSKEICISSLNLHLLSILLSVLMSCVILCAVWVLARKGRLPFRLEFDEPPTLVESSTPFPPLSPLPMGAKKSDAGSQCSLDSLNWNMLAKTTDFQIMADLAHVERSNETQKNYELFRELDRANDRVRWEKEVQHEMKELRDENQRLQKKEQRQTVQIESLQCSYQTVRAELESQVQMITVNEHQSLLEEQRRTFLAEAYAEHERLMAEQCGVLIAEATERHHTLMEQQRGCLIKEAEARHKRVLENLSDKTDNEHMEIDPLEAESEPMEIDPVEADPEPIEIDPIDMDEGMVESRKLGNQIEALQRRLANQSARLARAEETIKGRGEVIEAGNKACQVLDKEVRTLKSQLEDEREAHMAEAAAIQAEYAKKMADLDLSLAIEKVKYLPSEGSDDGLNDDDSKSEEE